MTLRSLALIVLLAAAGLIWFFRDDPVAEVRAAHLELAGLIVKADGESAAAVALQSLALRDLFADPVAVSGDAQGMLDTYTPEDLANRIVRLRSVSQRVDLSLGELIIEFPSPDIAVTEFSAELTVESDYADGGQRNESRRVASHMRLIDGRWLFSEFQFADSGGR